MTARDLKPTLDKVQPFVMPPVSVDALVDLANVVLMVLACGIRGDFVECGVWRGGGGFLMAEILRQAGVRDRKVWLLDSFEGMPPVADIDGRQAIADANGFLSRERSAVPLEEVRRTALELGLEGHTEFIKGWFDETLPANRERIGPIALLHVDCDWHASVRCCLENLYDQVVGGGFVVFDDYYAYEGAAIAVHDFLGRRRCPHRIESVLAKWGGCDYNVAARLRKGEPKWQWDYRVHLAREDVAAVVPAGQTIVLVDDGLLGREVVAGRQRLPFFERDGRYWGPPADDNTAIRELEQARRSGATFIAFSWPTFWWLDYYSALNRQLASSFRCVLRNDRLVVFDLRT